MKRFLWIAPILFLLASGSAFATTILQLYPNDGNGYNFGFLQENKRGQLIKEVRGGTDYDFFNTGGYAPGSTLGGTTELFVAYGYLGSHELSVLAPATLFLSSFTLPTNGKNVTVPVTLAFSVLVTFGNGVNTINVNGRAKGTMSFYFVDGLYYSDGRGLTTVVPEPGTLGLTGNGIGGHHGLCSKET